MSSSGSIEEDNWFYRRLHSTYATQEARSITSTKYVICKSQRGMCCVCCPQIVFWRSLGRVARMLFKVETSCMLSANTVFWHPFTPRHIESERQHQTRSHKRLYEGSKTHNWNWVRSNKCVAWHQFEQSPTMIIIVILQVFFPFPHPFLLVSAHTKNVGLHRRGSRHCDFHRTQLLWR